MSVLLLGAVLATVGCTSIHTNNSATTAVPPATVIALDSYTPETELGSSKVSATVMGNSILGIINWGLPSAYADFTDIPNGKPLPLPIPVKVPFLGDDAEAFKKAAVYIACDENNCDSLLDARYVITRKSYIVFSQLICKVTGTPVIIKGYRKLECSKAPAEK